ncbi:NB-ARC domain-containing protein [Streptomyces sp. NPDC059883]|uniref:NB-ARC domain-containing protein n=1 Tax=unclassified Streptomyces TaxID=2593676 RepID=UPI003654B35E
MESELAALAGSGATALVGLMVSDAWTQAKGRLARFFARGGDESSADEELETSREELTAARRADDGDTETGVAAELLSRLLRILQDDPAAAAELRLLLRELTPGADGPPAATLNAGVTGGVLHGQTVLAGQFHGGITFNVREAPPSGPGTTPDQVPPLTVTYINHEADLALLDGYLGEGGAGGSRIGYAGLTGMPGVGKRALARSWAARNRRRFPDGLLHVDFATLRDQRDLMGGDVSAALRHCLRSLGMLDTHIPASFGERVELFRSYSAERRILIVLEDVNQPAQVSSLVPKGPGSALLVTGNGRLDELAMDGARLISLAPLDRAAGLELLADRCAPGAVEAEPGAAARLVEMCGGLPKALHLVAARLVTSRGRLTMSRLADELADESRRLTGMSLRGRGDHSMSAVLGLAYRDLPDDAARLYRLLGWFPGRAFDVATAAAAAGVDTTTAESSLDELEEASLLDRTTDGRFQFHDLVRLHARERAAAEEPENARRALVERVITHYLVLTAFADRAVREDRLRISGLAEDLAGLGRDAPDPFAAGGGPAPLDWLDAERATILAVLREAARLGLHHLVWPLSESFTVLFLHHRYLSDWKESLELGAASAAATVVPAAEARLRSLLSRPLMDLGEYDRARTELETAVACAEVSGHTVVRASVQEFSGRYWDRFDPSRAVAAYRLSIELNIEAGEPRGAAIATYFLGCAQDAAGDHERALNSLRRARRDLLGLPGGADRRMAARASVALGAVHEHLGESDEAIRVLSEAAGTLRAEGASHYEARALVRLADLTERTGGSPDVLRAQLTRAFEICEAGGSPDTEMLRQRLDRLDDGGDGGGT